MTKEIDNHFSTPSEVAVVPCHIVAVAGGKGGVGKTVVSAALAMALAEASRKVILIDADLGGANLHSIMGMHLPTRSLYDFYTRRVNTLDELVLDTPIPGLRMISGAPGSLGMANIRYWEKLKTIRQIGKLESEFVIIDIGAGMSFNEIDLFNAAHTGIVVANPEPTSIQESYNFIKVALFRKLHRSFMDNPVVMEMLGRCADPTHANDRRLIVDMAEEVRAKDLRTGVKFYKLLNRYSPKLILNRVFNYSEYLDGLSLQLAVQDMLRIKLEYWGYLSYGQNVPRAVRMIRPMDLLEPASEFRQKIVMMAQKHLLGKGIDYRAPGKRLIVPLTDVNSGNRAHPKVLQKQASRICSIHCALWGKCHYQEGGLACRMPESEYQARLNELQSRRAAVLFENGDGKNNGAPLIAANRPDER